MVAVHLEGTPRASDRGTAECTWCAVACCHTHNVSQPPTAEFLQQMLLVSGRTASLWLLHHVPCRAVRELHASFQLDTAAKNWNSGVLYHMNSITVCANLWTLHTTSACDHVTVPFGKIKTTVLDTAIYHTTLLARMELTSTH